MVSLSLSGCSDSSTDPDPPAVPDETPPESVIDLRTSTAQATSVVLNWTAPGDDGAEGTAAEYDLRFSTLPLDDSNWSSAPRVSGLAAPLRAGLTERVTVSGLSPLTGYYFVVSARDEANNWSGPSNFHEVTTGDVLDTVPPAPITDLAVASVTDSSATLTWTAPGDDGDVGTARAYDIRFLTEEIDIDNWVRADGPDFSPVPRVAGTPESWEVIGLESTVTYYFAIVVQDEEGNKSPLSNGVMATTD
jgi:hypothetical protein